VLACSSELLKRRAHSAIAVVLAVAFSTRALSADCETRWIEPGFNVDVYWSINLSGRVYLAADIDSQPACLDYWWIAWPFTQIKTLGRFCGRVTFDIPGLGDLAIGGKLRAGGAAARTRLRGTASESVAHQFPEIRF
jgi:hypothetical protein